MSFPTSGYREYLDRFRLSGIALEMYPSTVQGLSVELQGATANSTASSVWNAINFPPSSGGTLRYNWPVGFSTKTYYFRARHPAQPGYSAGPYTPVVSATPGKFPIQRPWIIPDVRFSNAIAQQGSIIPTPVSGTWSYNANAGAAFGAIAWSWSARVIYRPDGSTITIPASSGLSVPANPTTGTTAGGALGARTYYVRTAYIKSNGTTRRLYSTSGESSQLVGANNLLTVTAPSNPGGYDSWCVLIGTATNTEFTQGAGNVTEIAFGTNYTEPAGGATTTGTTPWNANWVGSIVEGYLGFSTVYYFYPYWDLAFAAQQPNAIGVIMGTESGLSAVSLTAAQGAQLDGRIPLSYTADSSALVNYIKATSAAASGSGSGSGLGGKF